MATTEHGFCFKPVINSPLVVLEHEEQFRGTVTGLHELLTHLEGPPALNGCGDQPKKAFFYEHEHPGVFLFRRKDSKEFYFNP